MSDYINGNVSNLIIQYGSKSNAVATVTAYTEEFELIYDTSNLFDLAFNLDFAVGKQLDILGKIVGIERYIPSFGVPDDDTYRFLIRAKVIRNYAKATMGDDNKLSIQDALDFLFNNGAYVTDNYNMSMKIWLDIHTDLNLIQYLKDLNLIPTPQGVRYYYEGLFDKRGTFGFYVHNTGFGDKFNGIDDKTYFASKIM